MARIGGVIVTYNPDIELLKKNINAVYNQLDEIVIVDNGSHNIEPVKSLIKKIKKNNKINLNSLKHNLGIAKAQNAGVSKLFNDQCKWALILDQDTIMPKDAIQKYCSTEQFLDSQTAILAARYVDKNWNEEQKKELFGDEIAAAPIQSVKMVIASGNLVRISAWKDVNGFDEWMFIDQVDFDFDAKLLLMNYKIWQVNTVVMNHEVGKTLKHPVLTKLLLLPKTAVFSDHSAFRQYYITRNSIVFAKRYPMFRRRKHLQIFAIIAGTRKIVGYSHSRFFKFFMSFKGIIDGLMYNKKKDDNFKKILIKIENKQKI